MSSITTKVLKDTRKEADVLVIGVFDAANTSNIHIINANSFLGANTSQPCHVTVCHIDYNFDIKGTGYIQLQWEGGEGDGNTAFFSGGGRTAGEFADKGNIPFFTANSANAAVRNSDINIQTVSLANLDTFSLIMRLTKDGGFANVANGYNKSVS